VRERRDHRTDDDASDIAKLRLLRYANSITLRWHSNLHNTTTLRGLTSVSISTDTRHHLCSCLDSQHITGKTGQSNRTTP
jgi:hypothetical protein